MSMRTLPLLFINLGGEMLYILDQRLRAQNTSEDNSQKNGVWSEADRKRVMNDIIATMFNKEFMAELLKPQELYSHRALRAVLTRLAHASVMRLNPASMDRLYELMVMGFKYQLQLCPRPRDLLLVTHNHMDAVRQLARDTPSIANQVDETRRKVIEVYTPLSPGEFQLLRQTLLIFFQDMHVRVSLFLGDGFQKPDGRFVLQTAGPVPPGTEVPGLIRIFNSKGKELSRREFPAGGNYTNAIREGSLELFGDRVTWLGTNMYSGAQTEATHTSKSSSQKGSSTALTPNPLAQEELNLLARLMGMQVQTRTDAHAETGFRVNLFTSDQEEEEAGASGVSGELSEVINIQATQDLQANTELARIAGQFAEDGRRPVGPGSKGEDLLAMMDEL